MQATSNDCHVMNMEHTEMVLSMSQNTYLTSNIFETKIMHVSLLYHSLKSFIRRNT